MQRIPRSPILALIMGVGLCMSAVLLPPVAARRAPDPPDGPVAAASPPAVTPPARSGVVETQPAQILPDPAPPRAHQLSNYAVAPPNHVWLIADGVLLHTTDHGRHWTQQHAAPVFDLA